MRITRFDPAPQEKELKAYWCDEDASTWVGIEASCRAGTQRFLAAKGKTGLSFEARLRAYSLVVLGGYPYRLTADMLVQPIPSWYQGYTDLLISDDRQVVALWNCSELAVLGPKTLITLFPNLGIEGIEVLSVMPSLVVTHGQLVKTLEPARVELRLQRGQWAAHTILDA